MRHGVPEAPTRTGCAHGGRSMLCDYGPRRVDRSSETRCHCSRSVIGPRLGRRAHSRRSALRPRCAGTSARPLITGGSGGGRGALAGHSPFGSHPRPAVPAACTQPRCPQRPWRLAAAVASQACGCCYCRLGLSSPTSRLSGRAGAEARRHEGNHEGEAGKVCPVCPAALLTGAAVSAMVSLWPGASNSPAGGGASFDRAVSGC